MIVMAATLALALGGAEARICDGGPYDQFDFWLGTWAIEQRVHLPDGSSETYSAKTNVSRSPDGCTITEHWRGTARLFWYGMKQPEEMWGFSVRSFDSQSGQWLISWMDNKNLRFGAPFAGRFEGQNGVFFQDGVDRRGRIRFMRLEKGGVHWDLATSPRGHNEWRILWEMDMRPLTRPIRSAE